MRKWVRTSSRSMRVYLKTIQPLLMNGKNELKENGGAYFHFSYKATTLAVHFQFWQVACLFN